MRFICTVNDSVIGTLCDKYWLTHGSECNMGFIFRDFFIARVRSANAINKIEKNKEHVA